MFDLIRTFIFKNKKLNIQQGKILTIGLIRHIISAFFPSVVLLKNGWQLEILYCYRTLNAITAKDRFLDPSKHELIDNIYGSQFSILEFPLAITKYGYMK